METTGQPMKIHISMETKLLLDTLGRFFTEHRGLVDVKGKVFISNNKNLEEQLQGKLDTYWLLGKEGGLGKQLTISLKDRKNNLLSGWKGKRKSNLLFKGDV